MAFALSAHELPRPTAGFGIASVAVAKSLDAGTTLVGLSAFERTEEVNPVVRAGFDAVGVFPALFWLSLGSVLLVRCGRFSQLVDGGNQLARLHGRSYPRGSSLIAGRSDR